MKNLKNLGEILNANKLKCINAGTHPCKSEAKGACFFFCGGCGAGSLNANGQCVCN